VSEGGQQQAQQRGQQQAQGGQQQSQQQAQGGQQQLSPLQRLTQALSGIRQVQNMLELQHPQQVQAIAVQRQAGDLIWQEIERMQQQQQQGS
jgi:hypothetical protein